MMHDHECIIEAIPVSSIRVVNSRKRDQKKYAEIVNSISQLGLKTPIVVTPRKMWDDDMEYDLVCGEGRLDVFKKEGETHIPARIIDAPREEVLLMSLVENIARRQSNKISLAKEIKRLTTEGYTAKEIAVKLGFTEAYVARLKDLIENGNREIVNAVIMGRLNITTALKIVACSDNQEIQQEISEAYEAGLLKANEIPSIQRMINKTPKGRRRQASGKSRDSVISEFKKSVNNHKNFLKKAKLCESALLFIKGAFNIMMEDDRFKLLLELEDIDNVPIQLMPR